MTKFKCRCFSWNWLKVRPIPNLEPTVRPTKSEVPVRKIKVHSGVLKEQVQFLNFTPEKVSRTCYPYNCPICMRFLSHILACVACRNYICHTCADELEANQSISSRCPHCNAEPLVLRDVEATTKIRSYFDSPRPQIVLEPQLFASRDLTYNQSEIKLSPVSDC